MSTLAFILFLMMALVSSGNAVSVGHTSTHDHSMTDVAMKSVSRNTAQLSGVNYNAATSTSVAIHSDSENPTASPELENTHCQHHDMSPHNARIGTENAEHTVRVESAVIAMIAVTAKNTESAKSAEIHSSTMEGVASHSGHSGEMTDMSCCMDECNCPTDHCFNLSATALIQPTVETEITVARMAAAAPVTGQRTFLHFGQFRPPKSLFTA
ncbi:hypothetical protein [Alteromonas sp. PRIM-21]|uniref:hypothetical protein n=1 Tax=Alteromonas sp. PRIM-21 TaxID=1454978 RepID=UPI0022B96872|nr:hypothetical protein [Alteromonas sp. PRIM-21]